MLDLVDSATTFDAAFNVVAAACQRGLTTSAKLGQALRSRTRVRWRGELVEALALIGDGTHSLLEYRYIHLVERPHGLPTATRQAKIASGNRNRYLDNLYEDYGVCVELDGLQAHPEDRRWQDLHRINSILEQGITTLRYGWIDVNYRSCPTASQIGTVLHHNGWQGRITPCPRCGT